MLALLYGYKGRHLEGSLILGLFSKIEAVV